MTRVDVSIPASDGSARGTLHVPAGDGPWPGVLLFPDAGGYRETFGEMGDHLAGLGFVALVPDIYYRAGEWAPFDVNTLFTDDKERARMFGVHRRTGRTARQRAHRRRVEHTVEFYPARHGFAVPDNDTYDPQASARHWDALRHLYRSHL